MKHVICWTIVGVMLCGGDLLAQDQTLVKELQEALRPLPSTMTPKDPNAGPPTIASGTGKPPLVTNIKFALNSTELTPDAPRYLDALGTALTEDRELRSYVYRIEGHTCNLGGAEYNRQLSLRRAKAVVEYLVGHFALQREQFKVVGYGADKPIESNDTEKGRDKNRRVVIVNTLKPLHRAPAPESAKLGLNVRVTYQKDGGMAELTPQVPLTKGDIYAVEFTPHEQANVYVCNVGSSGKIAWHFPNGTNTPKTNPVSPGLHRVPITGRWFELDDHPGTEHIVVLAFRPRTSDVGQIKDRPVDPPSTSAPGPGVLASSPRAKDATLTVRPVKDRPVDPPSTLSLDPVRLCRNALEQAVSRASNERQAKAPGRVVIRPRPNHRPAPSATPTPPDFVWQLSFQHQ